jgi:hypothetical protein
LAVARAAMVVALSLEERVVRVVAVQMEAVAVVAAAAA